MIPPPRRPRRPFSRIPWRKLVVGAAFAACLALGYYARTVDQCSLCWSRRTRQEFGIGPAEFRLPAVRWTSSNHPSAVLADGLVPPHRHAYRTESVRPFGLLAFHSTNCGPPRLGPIAFLYEIDPEFAARLRLAAAGGDPAPEDLERLIAVPNRQWDLQQLAGRPEGPEAIDAAAALLARLAPDGWAQRYHWLVRDLAAMAAEPPLGGPR